MHIEPQTVHVVAPMSLKRISERRETPYRLLNERAGWLSRFLWWALRKRRTMQAYSETVQRWTYVPHEQTNLHDAMLNALDAWWEHNVHGDGAVFIMGGQTFHELTGSPEFGQQMMFHTGPFGRQDPYYGRRYHGVDIHVVPNLSGMAVIPKVLIEREVTV